MILLFRTAIQLGKLLHKHIGCTTLILNSTGQQMDINFDLIREAVKAKKLTFNLLGRFREYLFCETRDLICDARELREIASKPRH